MTNRMLYQILDALDFVHTYNPQIIHRDIKPANILYQGNKFLLTDFGIAKVVDTSRTMAGSKWYAAPEVRQNGEQTPKVDIYVRARGNLRGVFGKTPTRSREGGYMAALGAVAPAPPDTSEPA